LSSLLVLTSCSFFDYKRKFQKDKTSLICDTARSFTKSLIYQQKVEKVVITRDKDSIQFFEEIEQLNKFGALLLINKETKGFCADTLLAMGLDFDSVYVVYKNGERKLTCLDTKSNLLFTVEKKLFLTFKGNNIQSKTLKINQQLVGGKPKSYEIDYTFSY
jgi:hypothetical protein